MPVPNDIASLPLQRAAAARWRVASVALCICLSACGGGGDDGAPPSDTTPGPVTPKAPALVVGAAPSVDSGASGTPVNVRIALSANGDGYAVWQAHDGTRHNLWANRYRAATAAWESAVNVESSSADVDDFDVTVDAGGNAVVAWHEAPGGVPPAGNGTVASARFDAAAGSWSAPQTLNTDSHQPRVASNATGTTLALYAERSRYVRGRFFDPATGTWQPEAPIEQNTTGTGFSSAPAVLVDDSGNALAAWRNERTGAAIVASNYFSTVGGWALLQPGETGLLGAVPGSVGLPSIRNVQLASATDGGFLVAWQSVPRFSEPDDEPIFISRFTPGTRTWSQAQTQVPANGRNIEFQRIGTDAAGTAFLLWTENGPTRRVLKALQVDEAGTICSEPQVIDAAVGGGAARADLGVDASGHAIAIWQQFEGGSPDDGSRSNIAVNRFDATTGAWEGAVLAETDPGNATSPRASARGGQALLAWIQDEGSARRVKALLQPLLYAP